MAGCGRSDDARLAALAAETGNWLDGIRMGMMACPECAHRKAIMSTHIRLLDDDAMDQLFRRVAHTYSSLLGTSGAPRGHTVCSRLLSTPTRTWRPTL